LNNNKPEIIKITFTEEQQKEIDAILENRPTEKQKAAWKARGMNLTRNYTLGSQRGRLTQLKQRFYHGSCQICHDLPNYKVIWHEDGVGVVEHYCEKHMPYY
jgi:hypothetical protein